jgi:signal transduction histidine kinase
VAQGKIHLHRSLVDLWEVAKDAAEIVASAMQDASQTLVMEGNPGIALVWGDAVRLTQVCANLLGNATKFSPPGSTIRVAVAVQGSMAVLSVSDQGVGIAQEIQETVFEMFSQGAYSPQSGKRGMGIGLALAKRLVELHDGRIWVKSEGPGKGSVFTCELPQYQDENLRD